MWHGQSSVWSSHYGVLPVLLPFQPKHLDDLSSYPLFPSLVMSSPLVSPPKICLLVLSPYSVASASPLRSLASQPPLFSPLVKCRYLGVSQLIPKRSERKPQDSYFSSYTPHSHL